MNEVLKAVKSEIDRRSKMAREEGEKALRSVDCAKHYAYATGLDEAMRVFEKHYAAALTSVNNTAGWPTLEMCNVGGELLKKYIPQDKAQESYYGTFSIAHDVFETMLSAAPVLNGDKL